jgi:two-component system phosphate regulon sensor histidine kinase PhoR
MSRQRNTFWLIALIATTALLLALFPKVPIIAGIVLGLLAGILLSTRRKESTFTPRQDRATKEEFASGTLLEATMTGIREALLVVDLDLRVVASNPAAKSLFSLVDSSPKQKRLTELTRNPAIYDAFLDALNGKVRSGVKVDLHEPSRRIFDLRVVPLKDGTGNGIEGAIGVFFDISRLERLERVRQEFLSNVSHELRTPLTAIMAFVETLENGVLEETDDQRRFLAIIRKNASRMHSLIDDILELSAIEAGNVRVEPLEIELYPLVNDVITSLAARASAQGVVVNNLVEPGMMVFADPKRLEQMLTNLLDNALKFSRAGGLVEISSSRGDITQIMVRDTGEGIPAQHLERLFERFYRVDRARSRDLGGTGLGLAIVKHLALAHGGEVRVKSKLGEGSTFCIELPALTQTSDERATLTQALSALHEWSNK